MHKQIIIEDYSPQWPKGFELLKTVYTNKLGDLILDVEHVGSTSVPGLAAKPIIDIDLVIDDHKKLNPVISVLNTLGYEHVGDMGITDREAFKRESALTPEDGFLGDWPAHNLYVCIEGSIALRNHLTLRDFLRSHPDKMREYGELKKRLAAENPYDIDLYIKNKTPFIIGILKDMGFDNNTLAAIRKSNKADEI